MAMTCRRCEEKTSMIWPDGSCESCAKYIGVDTEKVLPALEQCRPSEMFRAGGLIHRTALVYWQGLASQPPLQWYGPRPKPNFGTKP